MVDAASLAMPGADATVQGVDVMLSLAPPATRWSLRARDAALLAGTIGHKLPGGIGAVAGGIAMLGPDEWYAVRPEGQSLPDGAGLPLSIVDISSRAVGFIVEGAAAADMLMAGCPLDLARMAVGRATRTVFETVEIILFREGETRWRIEVWRSFAPWLWAALSAVG